MKKSVQLYSIKSLCERDMEQALREVSELGYAGVEFTGFFDHSADTIKGWLDKYQLKVSGAHIDPELVLENPTETIAYNKAIGNNRIIIPWYDLKNRDDVMALVKRIKAVAGIYKQSGMKLYYHNHDHEFNKCCGECLIDILANNTTADELSLEFDVYWIYRSGYEPIDYLQKYADRIDIFHAKDGTLTTHTAVGQGNLNWDNITSAAKQAEIAWVVVECEGDNGERNQYDDIKQSIAVLNGYIN